VSLLEALSLGPPPAGNLAIPVLARESITVEMYAPQGVDPQTPHDRDELYLIARGQAVFFDGNARRSVEAGTLLFVAAGQAHRFEEFSSDFATWVLFYGPVGGDRR
jgi:mannose-6-phosphate isomerase-like protein (cupin superfamily)